MMHPEHKVENYVTEIPYSFSEYVYLSYESYKSLD